MSLDLRLHVAQGDDACGVLDLYRWLSDDPDVAGGADLALEDGDDDDTRGTLGGLDVINAVVTDLTAAGQLVLAVLTWRGARSPGVEVRLERGTESVTISGGDPEDVRRVMESLGLLPPAPAGADPEVPPVV